MFIDILLLTIFDVGTKITTLLGQFSLPCLRWDTKEEMGNFSLCLFHNQGSNPVLISAVGCAVRQVGKV